MGERRSKGWAYIRVAKEIVPTWYCFSERHKEIEPNDVYRRHKIKEQIIIKQFQMKFQLEVPVLLPKEK